MIVIQLSLGNSLGTGSRNLLVYQKSADIQASWLAFCIFGFNQPQNLNMVHHVQLTASKYAESVDTEGQM